MCVVWYVTARSAEGDAMGFAWLSARMADYNAYFETAKEPEAPTSQPSTATLLITTTALLVASLLFWCRKQVRVVHGATSSIANTTSAPCVLVDGILATAALSGDTRQVDDLVGTLQVAEAPLVDSILAASENNFDADLMAGLELPVAWIQPLLESINTLRAALAAAQNEVRVASDAGRTAAIRKRNEARRAFITALEEAQARHDGSDAAGQVQRMSAELDTLRSEPTGEGLLGAARTRQLRREHIERTLPTLEQWLSDAAVMERELIALRPHESGTPPSRAQLMGLHESWKRHKKDLALAEYEVKIEKPNAEAKLQRARRALQSAARALRGERELLARIAEHFPELYSQEKLLQLDEVAVVAGGDALRHFYDPLREFSHYSGPNGAATPMLLSSANHNVYHAEDGGDPCVLKEYSMRGAPLKTVLRQVRVLSELRHPYIAPLRAVFADPPTAYLQFDFYSLGDFEQWARQPLELSTRKRALVQLLQALEYLHGRGVVHGDVKLSNLFISADGTAHLADFELSREQHTSGATTTTTGIGFSPRYVAPELLSDVGARPALSTQADMYAFGVAVLLACCKTSASFDSSQYQPLRAWDHASAEAVDIHLPELLAALLQPAGTQQEPLPPQSRLSASQGLVASFFDPAEAEQAARRATELAQQQRDELQRREAAFKGEADRMARQLEADSSRRLRDSEEATARARRELQIRERAVEQEAARTRMEIAQREEAARQEQVALQEQLRQLRLEREDMDANKRRTAQERDRLAAREQQLRDEQTRARAMQEEAAAQRARAEEAQRRAMTTHSLWTTLVGGVDTDRAVTKFFNRRQGGRQLRILEVVKVENRRKLESFSSAGDCDLNIQTARQNRRSDTLLFHGCSPEAAPNIQSTGLLVPGTGGVSVAHGSMMGNGIYGAPDPRKSMQYVGNGRNKFLFICRFNLSRHRYTQNKTFDEFCVFDQRHVVVLWMLKIE